MQYINFIQDPSNDYPGETIAYLKLCGISIAAAIIIGVLLGALVSRNAIVAFLAVNLSGLIRAIPIIAIFLMFVPTLGIGFKPAIIALIILGIPPILLNTYTGIRGVEPAMIDAAKGMGMTTLQIATRIQAPLVTPLVAAGIRTSAVQIVATATLGGFIAAGGYGDYIIDAINVGNNTELIVGAVSVAILAIFVEVFMSWLQSALTPQGSKYRSRWRQPKHDTVSCGTLILHTFIGLVILRRKKWFFSDAHQERSFYCCSLSFPCSSCQHAVVLQVEALRLPLARPPRPQKYR
jgi:osmoprotectant transport system permease protein